MRLDIERSLCLSPDTILNTTCPLGQHPQALVQAVLNSAAWGEEGGSGVSEKMAHTCMFFANTLPSIMKS